MTAAFVPHETVEGCLDCPHPDICAGMGKCEIGAAKLAGRTWDDLACEFIQFADAWDERTQTLQTDRYQDGASPHNKERPRDVRAPGVAT